MYVVISQLSRVDLSMHDPSSLLYRACLEHYYVIGGAYITHVRGRGRGVDDSMKAWRLPVLGGEGARAGETHQTTQDRANLDGVEEMKKGVCFAFLSWV